MLNWDDLRVFIATARTKSFAGAGQRLNMDPTTVSRRVSRLESSLKATLFVRSPLGLHLTAAGARLSEAGVTIEAAMDTVNEDESPGAVSGTVRLSVAEGFGGQIVAPALPTFLGRRRGLRLELVANAGLMSPTVREVDIAVTLVSPTSSKLFVERLTDFELGLYASPGYLKQRGTPTTIEQLADHELIGFIDDLLYTSELRFLQDVHASLRPTFTCSSIGVQLAFAATDGGIVVLPHYVGRPNKEIVVPILNSVTLTRTFWMSVHRDLSDASRLRAVRLWLIELVNQKQKILSPSVA